MATKNHGETLTQLLGSYACGLRYEALPPEVVDKARTLVLHGLGIRQARVRHHGEIARLEVPPDDFEIVLSQREKIAGQLRQIGYTFVALDLAGYRMGSLNELIKANKA